VADDGNVERFEEIREVGVGAAVVDDDYVGEMLAGTGWRCR